MNNHFRGQAVANALQLQQMLTGEMRAAPESLTATYPVIATATIPSPASQKTLF